MLAAILLFAFVCGSIPFGVIVARSRGIDLRSVGSGNVGAANVARAVGKRLGVFVLSCDAAKGALPVAVARAWYGVSAELPEARIGISVVAASAVVGHCFSPWLKFRGGKGVATSLGVFLVIDPVAVAVSAALFGACFALTRVVAVGSLVGAVALPISMWFLGRAPTSVAFAGLVVFLVVLLHRDNLSRLRVGAEHRLD